jgi:recombination protein RecA
MGKLGKGGPARAGSYFTKPASDLTFLSSGCAVLDCVLGGGWVFGRMSNIIGDRSTAKTGLAMEAAAQFQIAYPGNVSKYRESEGAFDREYGRSMGMPVDSVRFWQDDYGPDSSFETVEDMFEDLSATMRNSKKEPCLYIVDSLDALSSRTEMKMEIDEASYGGNKPKKVGETFRRLVRDMERSRMCFIIISQVRDKIGVKFGERHTRTGGKAMDFYASHCLWLSHVQTISVERNRIKRAIGIKVKAHCKKNKVALPFRECEFDYKFGYGIDDLVASIDWLDDLKVFEDIYGQKKTQFLKTVEKLDDPDYRQVCQDLAVIVREKWSEVETSFIPTRRKYG